MRAFDRLQLPPDLLILVVVGLMATGLVLIVLRRLDDRH
jgi:hypothetical protein